MIPNFGRPSKVILLSNRNTQRLPDMAASTLLRLLKPRLLSLRAHLDSITQIFPHRDIDVEVYLNEAFYPSLDQPSLLDRINPFVGDF